MGKLYKAIIILLFPALAFAADPMAARIRLNTSTFNGSLNSSDTDVQKAIEKLDESVGGTGISLTDLSATNPVVYNSGTGVFSFNTSYSLFTNYYNKTGSDARYLQSYTETDPVWVAARGNYFNISLHTLDNITNGTTYIKFSTTQKSNYDTAYGWGDWGTAGLASQTNLTNHTGDTSIHFLASAVDHNSTGNYSAVRHFLATEVDHNTTTNYALINHVAAAERTTWDQKGTSNYTSNQGTNTTDSATFSNLTVNGSIKSHNKGAGFTIINITAAHDVPLWEWMNNATLTRISLFCGGGTNVVGMLKECNSTGANCTNVNGTDWTVPAGELVITNFDNSTMQGGNFTWWQTTSVGGTPLNFTVRVTYNE